MNRILPAFVLLGLLSTSLVTRATAATGLPRSSPEEQGISSAALLTFIEAADAQIDGMHSFMLVRHGAVVAEGWWTPYRAEARHQLYSLSKSFTSTAVGLAIGEGRLRLEDPVVSFFPDDLPAEVGNNLKAMRVRDLLCMSTGHQNEPPTGPDLVSARTFLAQPVPFKPGTHFLYNTAATFMLSAIVQKTTGQTTLDYLKPRLFEPLGIVDPTWDTNRQGISLGGYGLSVRTEDIARFGQLYLQRGVWDGRPLVSAAWVATATAKQTSNGSNPASDWDQGYGFQFWRCRNGAYRGDGAFGQYCIVMPEQDTVVAITAGVRDMQAVLNLIWSRLLPALEPRRLPSNPGLQQALEARLKALVLPVPRGAATSGRLPGLAGRTFGFPANDLKLETLAIRPGSATGQTLLTVRVEGREQRLVCARAGWTLGSVAIAQFGERPAATAGAWTAEDTFTARICYYETPFVQTITLKFTDDTVQLDSEMNVGFGPTRTPQLTGRPL